MRRSCCARTASEAGSGAADHAGRIAAQGLFAEVHACALKGAPGLNEVVAAVHAPELVFVPLLMAEGYTLRCGAAKARSDDRPSGPGDRVPSDRRPSPAGRDDRDQGAGAVRDEGLAAGRHRAFDRRARHQRHPELDATARRHAAQVAARGIFAEVATGFLDERPLVPQTLGALGAPHCLAVGLFVDAGEHGEEDIPALLAPAGDRAVYAGPSGRTARYRADPRPGVMPPSRQASPPDPSRGLRMPASRSRPTTIGCTR